MTLQQVSEDYEEMRPLSASGTYVGHDRIASSTRTINFRAFCGQHPRKFNPRIIRTRFRAPHV